MKKVLGIVFIVIASFFTLGIIVQAPRLIGMVIDYSQDQATTYGKAFFIGYIAGWVTILAGIITLYVYGIKWVKKPKKK
jgi:hypothetical protein